MGASKSCVQRLLNSNRWSDELLKWEQLCCPKQSSICVSLMLVCFLLLQIVVILVSIFILPSTLNTQSQLLNNGLLWILIIAPAGSVVSLSRMILQRQRMWKITSELQLFDRTLLRLDFRIRCNEINYWGVGWAAIFAVGTSLFNAAAIGFGSLIFNPLNLAVLIVLINIINLPRAMLTVWFIICELCVWYRIKSLCKLLTNGRQAANVATPKDTAKYRILVAGTTALHYNLSCVVEHINGVFGVQVVFSMVGNTVLNIFCIFACYRAAVVMGEVERLFSMMLISWTFYTSSIMLPAVLYGAWLCREATQFAREVHAFLRQVDDEGLQNQLCALSQQSQHRSMALTVGGHTLNWPVFATMIGFIITYVVILIQFDSKAMEIERTTGPEAAGVNYTDHTSY
ncbi:uncharacterized protein LOC131211510 [Anopheles bellator]|uniref:uncharacterized protein LOC131211510 n=1 Tax=Anopheles bellator TaxID=139047 RepID=UPI002647BE7C|nr:uncharacterized protein LOC131211510 [Anopheles bellator]